MGTDLKERRIALIGWSLQTIEAADQLGISFVVVSFSDFENYATKHKIPFNPWDFGKNSTYDEVYERSEELYEQLKNIDVDVAIPVFEETVEWAGALNSRFRNNPRIFYQSLLFRDKPTMKRKALLGGLRVGVFEEAKTKEDLRQFIKKTNDLFLNSDNKTKNPIHIKPFNKAGTAGHRVVYCEEDIEKMINDSSLPCMIESHLDGVEFSCEVFIFNKKIIFLNITEYVKLGYASLVPPSTWLEGHREEIRQVIQQLVNAFEIEYGFIHPEFFLDDNGIYHFGEVAYRIPGGHIFDLIQKTYNFNPFQAYILCNDPNCSEEELKKIFPHEKSANGYAGSFLVYPKIKQISGINLPPDLEQHPCFDKHTLLEPMTGKVVVEDHEGFGSNYGAIFFHGNDCEQIKQPLMQYVDHNFYV